MEADERHRPALDLRASKESHLESMAARQDKKCDCGMLEIKGEWEGASVHLGVRPKKIS